MENKVYVLDTTVLIEAPDYMYRGEGMFVIPIAVIKEIDGLKNCDQKEVAKAARKVARTLDNLGSRGNLSSGVRLSTGGTLRVYTNYIEIDDLNSRNDNRIVGAALALKKETGENVELLTTHINMRTVARAHGVKAEIPDCVSVLGEDTDIKMINAAERTSPWIRIARVCTIAFASVISVIMIYSYGSHWISTGSAPRGLSDAALMLYAVWFFAFVFRYITSPSKNDKTEYGPSNYNKSSSVGPKEVFDPKYSGLGCNIYRDE